MKQFGELFQTADWKTEKHVPVIECSDRVKAGEILEQDDYFARQDMDPKFCEEQLMFNRELMELVNTHGSRMNIAVASSASTAVVNRAVESGMKLFWWNPMYDDYEKEGGLTRRICDMNGLPCVNAGGNGVLGFRSCLAWQETRRPARDGLRILSGHTVREDAVL